MNNHIPVLIVGAGPTGLTMACELARRGIPFRIIDKKPERTLTSNAVGMQPRTIELLDQMGIVNQFLKEGNFCNAAHMHVKGKTLGRISFNQLDSFYKFVLMIPQSETERLLLDRLAEFNKEVERTLELIDLKQENNTVISTIKDSEGNTETLTSDWLIGCDGANSMIRQKSGIVFPGEDLPEQFVVADAQMDSFQSNTELHVYFNKGTLFAVFALGSNKYRIAANIHQSHPRKIFVEKEVKEIVNERSYGDYSVSAVSWISPFWIHSKIVNTMRSGAIFLAGDAAHIHSPAGGQGMNTGIQDAYNLAWKLSLVINGHANPTLLDSYHGERYPVVSKIVQRTERFTKAALFENPFLINLRNCVFKILFSQPKLLKKISMIVTQLAIQYKNSPVIDYQQSISRKSPRGGKRAPDVMITATSRLFDYLRDTRHHILLFPGQKAAEDQLIKMQQLQRWLNQTYPELVKTYIITKQKIADVDDTIIDLDNKIYNKYHIKGEAIYIIRPDNYIAYCANKVDQNSIQQFFARYLIA